MTIVLYLRAKPSDDMGLGDVQHLNCQALVSGPAWTPGSAYCLVEAAGEIFGPESKTWLLLVCVFHLAPIFPFQLVETERPTSLNK